MEAGRSQQLLVHDDHNTTKSTRGYNLWQTTSQCLLKVAQSKVRKEKLKLWRVLFLVLENGGVYLHIQKQ